MTTDSAAEPADVVRPGEGALEVLRRGLAVSPELRPGLALTLLMGLAVAAGRIVVPIVLQRAIDDGFTTVDGSTAVDLGFIAVLAGIAIAGVVMSAVLAAAAQRRLVRTAETTILRLRVRAFEHIHRLSLAQHVDTSSGQFLARVTSDIESLARFIQWGLMSWTISPSIIVGVLVVMTVYSWQLTLIVLVVFVPAWPTFRWLQRRQLAAYDELRTSVSGLLGETNESITGAETIRAYDVGARAEHRVQLAVQRRYRAGLRRNRYMAVIFGVGDLFGSVAFAMVFAIGVWQRDAWGLSSGTLVAFLFLITLLNEPVGELGETTDQTQEAIAGWRKVLELLDTPIDVVEPESGHVLPTGPLTIDAAGVSFSYATGGVVVENASLHIAAGTNVAIVGATGSGKTTFAKLLCRLADPTVGEIRIASVPLPEVDSASRHAAIRMVPQDGFLFDTSLGENLRYGRSGATDDDIADATERLGLSWWIERLPAGFETQVGSRGTNLSVGERQLVALIRAALADPGLLVLDEATSAVDPETDQALTQAIVRLSQGRTLVSIAHRLATAEAADLVVVFDDGRIVEVGGHDELVEAGGVYAQLHSAWVGNTTSSQE